MQHLSCLCFCFFTISPLTLAQCWDDHCVNDHMFPLLVHLNPDQQTLDPSLREEILLVMSNLSGEIRRQIQLSLFFLGQ